VNRFARSRRGRARALRLPQLHWLAPDPELRGWHLSAGRMNWLAVSLALVIAPHALRLPLWISALFALLCTWRLWKVQHGDDRPPRRAIVVFIALAIVPAVYLSIGTITGRQAGVALLTLLAAIKLLEARGLRDAYILNYLGFFLVITNFLFDQSMLTGVYMLAVVTVMTASLSSLGESSGHSPAMAIAANLGRAGVLVAQAVPLMLVLFVLFPRIPGPLWGLPKDAWSAVSGLSEEMSPGDISNLSQSDAVAFRVQFQGQPPPPPARYWRGPVLDVTDGRRWSRGARGAWPRPVRFQRAGAPLDYEVTLEAHGKRWLFALDLPAATPAGATMSEALELRAGRDVRERMRYRMRSYPVYRLEAQSAANARALLHLPAARHPRTKALARGWRDELGDPRAVVERAMAWFAREGFVYTLTPPRLDGDAVDEFLFGSREGFCEHYAAAFVVLMRAAGVPARVVTGYQGGEQNPINGYVVVRQRDAHAWAEVWLAGLGWTRVDPTAAVVPQRIDQGMSAAIPRSVGAAGLSFTPAPALADSLRRVRQALDAVQTSWNAWVLGYGASRQRELLAGLGIDAASYGTLVITLTLALAALLGLLALWLFSRRQRRDPVRAAYASFCARLSRRGITRRAAEGPLDFAARVARRRPDLRAAVDAITSSYVALRYGRGGDPRALQRQVSNFRP
jgi:transglutaminase-like putative cysteine protease